jgi:hypothetical protein
MIIEDDGDGSVIAGVDDGVDASTREGRRGVWIMDYYVLFQMCVANVQSSNRNALHQSKRLSCAVASVKSF